MRWDSQQAASDEEAFQQTDSQQTAQLGSSVQSPAAVQSPLLALNTVLRTVQTPDFSGVTFHEILAKSVLNKVPAGSNMPFGWTINPYRGCSHACVYCFARKTHTYLDFDAGADFDSQVVVKVNAAEVLRGELAKPSWKHEPVALGTNTDPYQRAEGRYQLMPGIIRELASSRTPFSILTKGTLLSRDIPLLREASAQVPIGVAISLALLDPELGAILEPGTPSPKARLHLITRLREAGLPCGVMAMPIIPWLTDSDEALDELFAALRQAGATGVTAGALYLRPGTRDWFMKWLAAHHPELVGRYRRLYGQGSYAPKEYRSWLAAKISAAKAHHGFAGNGAAMHRVAAAGTGYIEDPRVEEAQYPVGAMPQASHADHTEKRPGRQKASQGALF